MLGFFRLTLRYRFSGGRRGGDDIPNDGGCPSGNRPERYSGFDAIRITAAFAVVLAHSFQLTGRGSELPTSSIAQFDIKPGAVAVSVFFIASGFLVAQSWGRIRSVGPFVRNRFARIWPALVTVVVLSVFVLGPSVTTLSTRSYFTAALTWNYLVKNCVLVFGFAPRLPGVFVGQPASAVNVSLWTLPQEVYAYAILLGCGVVGLLRRRWGSLMMFVAFVGLWRFGHLIGVQPGGINLDAGIANVHLSLELEAWFFSGVALAYIPFRGVRLAALGGALLAAAFLVGEPLLLFLGLPMVVVAGGTSAPAALGWLHRVGDPSYGIYIYSFPLQQLLFRYGVATEPLPMFLISGTLVLALGIASWRWLERPALRALKRSPTRPAVGAAQDA